jgi:hypothetical protein
MTGLPPAIRSHRVAEKIAKAKPEKNRECPLPG